MPRRWVLDEPQDAGTLYSRLRADGLGAKAARAWVRRVYPTEPILGTPPLPPSPPADALVIADQKLKETEHRVIGLEALLAVAEGKLRTREACLVATTRELSQVRKQALKSGQDARAKAAEATARIKALERELAAAQRRVEELEAEVASAGSGRGNPLYARVGLDPRCPEFVLRAARTAYRKALHPDHRSPEHKREAEERFKASENAFDRLFKLRGL